MTVRFLINIWIFLSDNLFANTMIHLKNSDSICVPSKPWFRLIQSILFQTGLLNVSDVHIHVGFDLQTIFE